MLTGVSASEPIEANPLNEAMVGQTCFPSTLATGVFLAYTIPERLPVVISALEALDWQALEDTFNPLQMSHEKIYL